MAKPSKKSRNHFNNLHSRFGGNFFAYVYPDNFNTMIKTALPFFILLMGVLPAQSVSLTTLLNDKISIRAIAIDKNKVYYAGTGSKFGYVSIKNPADQKQMLLSEKNLQFRTLAQDRNFFYTINIESPAQFFRIDKKTLSHTVFHTDEDKNAFYDALHYGNGMFYTFSDPNPDLKLKFLEFNLLNDRFISKAYDTVLLNEGEAAFAASNTNIASSKNYIWMATGGKRSRILRQNLASKTFEVFETPFVQGTSSQGIYSIDFYKERFGIAAGGDYTKQKENVNNLAVTYDAGKTWQPVASGANAGYTTCVRIRPGSRGREILAVGDQHISYSKDFGKTWNVVSEEKGFYVAEWISRKQVVLAGNGKISLLDFK